MVQRWHAQAEIFRYLSEGSAMPFFQVIETGELSTLPQMLRSNQNLLAAVIAL